MQQVRQAYASVADLYLGLFGTSQQVHADDLAFIGRHLTIAPGNVLDLGCGPGHLTGHLRSLGVDATGIDMVPEFIAHAKTARPSGKTGSANVDSLAEGRSTPEDAGAYDEALATVILGGPQPLIGPIELRDYEPAWLRRYAAEAGSARRVSATGWCAWTDVLHRAVRA